MAKSHISDSLMNLKARLEEWMRKSNTRNEKGPGELRVSLRPKEYNNFTSQFLITSVMTDLSPLDHSQQLTEYTFMTCDFIYIFNKYV